MDEKAEFSRRLHAALKQAGIRTVSPTKLAIDFNLHHRGKPVSTQAAHKWLNGTAIPSQDKIRTLAGWLKIAPEWLRFGDTGKSQKAASHDTVPPYLTLEEQLLSDFRRLSEASQIVGRDMIAMLRSLESTVTKGGK